jgi:hypothetical protein
MFFNRWIYAILFCNRMEFLLGKLLGGGSELLHSYRSKTLIKLCVRLQLDVKMGQFLSSWPRMPCLSLFRSNADCEIKNTPQGWIRMK